MKRIELVFSSRFKRWLWFRRTKKIHPDIVIVYKENFYHHYYDDEFVIVVEYS